MRSISVLLSTSLILLSSQVFAAKPTIIKIAEIQGPVNVGIFKGDCTNVNLDQFKTSADFRTVKLPTCEYIDDAVLQAKKSKPTLKAFHQGRASLFLIAFQPGGKAVQCPIDDAYEEMYIRTGNDGNFFCSSPQATSDHEGDEDASDSTTDEE